MDEILKCFQALGFTEYEAKVYLSLLQLHPASAYTVSQNSGVPHSRVYDISRRLIDKGLAVRSGKNPETFYPLSPEELVRKLKNSSRNTIEHLEKCLSAIPFRTDFDPVWNLSSRTQALNLCRDLIGEALSTIYICLWDEDLTELLNALQDAFRRKVAIVFLIYGASKIDFGRVYYHNTAGITGVDTLGRTMDCVVDSSVCLSGSLGEKAPCQVVWTRNRGLVKSIEEYIVHDLYIAELKEAFGPQIEQKFGRNLKQLRIQFGR